MASFTSLVKGLGIGAAAMYFFDPIAGRRRRSMVRDQLISLGHEIQDFVDKGIRDLENRTKGIIAEVGHSLAGTPAPPDVLSERIRSVMGRYVGNPHAIDVSVQDGRVILKGAIRSDEVQPFIHAVEKVRGVNEVENDLEVRQPAEAKELSRRRAKQALLRQAWPPGTRLLGVAAGSALMLNCMAKRTPGAILLGTLGFGLFLRATVNRPLPELAEEFRQPQRALNQPHTNRLMAGRN